MVGAGYLHSVWHASDAEPPVAAYVVQLSG
jgi:hypothetical protein